MKVRFLAVMLVVGCLGAWLFGQNVPPIIKDDQSAAIPEDRRPPADEEQDEDPLSLSAVMQDIQKNGNERGPFGRRLISEARKMARAFDAPPRAIRRVLRQLRTEETQEVVLSQGVSYGMRNGAILIDDDGQSAFNWEKFREFLEWFLPFLFQWFG